LIDKNLPRGFHGGELQFFFGAEMREESALAHFQIVGEPANREAFEPFDGG
jgi:hypothetical protein